jgi:hypothetical protein
MKSKIHTVLSSLTAAVLVSTTLISGATAGLEADLTVLSFALLVVYGLIELVILSYSESPVIQARPAVRRVRVENAVLVPMPLSGRRARGVRCDVLAA